MMCNFEPHHFHSPLKHQVDLKLDLGEMPLDNRSTLPVIHSGKTLNIKALERQILLLQYGLLLSPAFSLVVFKDYCYDLR